MVKKHSSDNTSPNPEDNHTGRRTVLKSAGVAGLGLLLPGAATAADCDEKQCEDNLGGIDSDSSTLDSSDEGTSIVKHKGKSIAVDSDRKAAAVGRKAPDDVEVKDNISVQATDNDTEIQDDISTLDTDKSDVVHGDLETDDGRYSMGIVTKMNGSFSSGWTAGYSGDGSTYCYADYHTDEENYVDPPTTPETTIKSEFSISGVSANISTGGGGFGFVSDTKLRYKETHDGMLAEHSYENVEASSPIILYNAKQSDTMTLTADYSAHTITAQLKIS